MNANTLLESCNMPKKKKTLVIKYFDVIDKKVYHENLAELFKKNLVISTLNGHGKVCREYHKRSN